MVIKTIVNMHSHLAFCKVRFSLW